MFVDEDLPGHGHGGLLCGAKGDETPPRQEGLASPRSGSSLKPPGSPFLLFRLFAVLRALLASFALLAVTRFAFAGFFVEEGASSASGAAISIPKTPATSVSVSVFFGSAK
jgi:hypothetical protein